MKKLNKTKILTIISAMFAIFSVLLIGYKEFGNAKREIEMPEKKVSIYSEYFLDKGIEASQVPDDSRPLFIHVGDFKVNPDSSVKFIDDGMKPTTFAQRVVAIEFKINYIPKDTKPLRQAILDLTEAWKIKGSDVQAFLVDYRPENPDFDAYNKFLYDLRRINPEFKYQTVNYHTVPYIDKKWIGNEKMKKEYLKIAENSLVFFVDVNEDDLKSDDKLKKISEIGSAFKIKLPANGDKIEFNRALLKQSNYFGSGVLTLDKTFVKPETGVRVGIWPKFITDMFNCEKVAQPQAQQ